MAQALTLSRLANLAAQSSYDAFDRYQTQFQTLARRAGEHFEARRWNQLQADTAERIDVYGVTVSITPAPRPARCRRRACHAASSPALHGVSLSAR